MLHNAFFLESFAKNVGSVPKDKLFLLGLFYQMPSAFGVRPEVFFSSIQLPEEITELYKEESLQPYLKLIDMLDSENLEEFIKELGLSKEELEEHLKYAEESVNTFMS